MNAIYKAVKNSPIQGETKIFRMTHIKNLWSIANDGFLFSANSYPGDNVYEPIHNNDVQSKRGQTVIPFGQSITLLDCVPFYFGVKTPMLYVNRPHQQDIIYFEADPWQIAVQGYSYVFTDGHAIKKVTEWYNDINDLCRLDWESINRKYWSAQNDPTEEYKRKKQAEFLVLDKLSWDMIQRIIVFNEQAYKAVISIMQRLPQNKQRPVFLGWQYYFR